MILLAGAVHYWPAGACRVLAESRTSCCVRPRSILADPCLSARFESHFSLFDAHSRRNIVLFLPGPGTGNSAHHVPARRQLRPRQ